MAVERHGGQEDSYLASVSDLMIGMLFIFIIMLMAFALNFRSAEERASQSRAALEAARSATAMERDAIAQERDGLLQQRDALREASARLLDLETQRSELLRGIAAELQARALPVELDAANGVLRLPESLLFNSGEGLLRPEGEAALAAVGEVLAGALPCYSQAPAGLQARCQAPPQPLLEAVLVEGHTDEVPLRGGAFGDNWALSAARGVNTFKALIRFAPTLESLQNQRGEALLGVAGYESRRPIVAGSTTDQRRRNRRIDLRFVAAAPDDAEIDDLLRRIGGASRP